MKIDLGFFILLLILNLIFFITYPKISKILNLYDVPDFKRKIHKQKIAASGGILFYLLFILYNIEIFSFNENIFTFRENISLIAISSIFFFIGIIDDKFVLGSNTKLYLMILFSFCLVLINTNFSIQYLNFSFTEKQIILGEFSILFTVICILCFVNACNMFDGVDLQFGIYIIILSTVFIYKGFMINFQYAVILTSAFFLINNYQRKIFIGNNGTLFLSILLSIFFIGSYSKEELFFVDEIFICMAIPGYDLIRVSLSRLSKGKHMFSPDNEHIHHYLIYKLGVVKSNVLIQSSIIIPIITFYIYESFFVSLLLSLFCYLSLYLYAKKIEK